MAEMTASDVALLSRDDNMWGGGGGALFSFSPAVGLLVLAEIAAIMLRTPISPTRASIFSVSLGAL